jgi:hypothetical protein
MQAGPLVASQPALTLGDALISLSLGVTLYEEQVRVGWWLIPEIIGVGLVLAGVVGLSRLDILPQESAEPTPRQTPVSPGAAARLGEPS